MSLVKKEETLHMVHGVPHVVSRASTLLLLPKLIPGGMDSMIDAGTLEFTPELESCPLSL